MQGLQQSTMKEFLKLVGKKTMSEYGELTGIERTRFFRLIHGSPMRLDEFERIQAYIIENTGRGVNWRNVVQKASQESACSTQQSFSIDMSMAIERRMRLRNLMNESLAA